MKNNYKILIVILIVFLSGCHKTPEKIETIYDPYDFNYKGTVTNITAFYDLSNTFNSTSQGYELQVDLNPKMELLAKDLKIKIEYVVENLKLGDKESKSNTYNFTVTSSTGQVITNFITNSTMSMYSNQYDLISIKIIEVSGSIYTKQKVDTINTPEKLNKDNYDKLVLNMKKYDYIRYNNYLTVRTSLENKYIKDSNVTSENGNSVVKVRLSPFYMEIDNLDEKKLLIEEEEYIYSFDITSKQRNGLNLINRNIFGFSSRKDEYYNYEEIMGSGDFDVKEMDYTKIKIEISENNYIISGRYKDLLSKEDFQQLKNLYISLGYKESILNDATFKLTITLEDDGFTLETHAIIPVNTTDYDSIENITTISINLKEFSIIDPYDKNKYYYATPSKFEDVLNYTNVLEDVEPIKSKSSIHYYLTHLEGGQYYFKDYTGYLSMQIYNLNQDRVDLGKFFGEVGNHPFKYYFTIPEGDYYIRINDIGGIGYKFKFEKLDFKDYYDSNNPTILNEGSFDFEIEGSYDMIFANYYSNKNGVLKVTNNTDKFSKVYYNDGVITAYVNETFGDGRFYAIVRGNNYFYFHGDKAMYNYNIEFIELDDNKDMVDIIDINDYNDWIITGPKFKNSYFKFDVKEKGDYKFIFENLNTNSSGPQIYIHDLKTDMYIATSKGKEILTLDVGSYYIKAASTKTSVYKITYVFQKLT